MLRFRLERGGDGMKHWQKMKRRQQAHLDSMDRKRGMMRCRGDDDRMRGGTGEGRGTR
jgi:hypothetical protein